MAYGLILRLLLAVFTFTVAMSQSEFDDSEVLACRLTSKLQRAESTSDAQITAILEYKFTQIEYEGAIQCRLEGRDGTVQYVPFSVVVLHDPPTELRVTIPMALRAKLEASTMICRYADIGPERHVHNEIPDTVKQTKENGVYKCGEGTDFQIVLTELLENSANPRQKRMAKNLMCSRFGTKPDQDAPANAVKAEYCDMFNGTAGVKMFTEKDGYQCSRCCPNHVFNIKKMMCEPCPAHSHRKGYSIFRDCFPGDPSDQTQPPSNSRNEPSIQFKELIDRNTTFISIAWALSGERSLFSHFQVVMEREAFSPREFETDETFLNITNLTPHTSYCFTVTAVSVAVEKGKDLKSKVLKVQTLFVIPTVEDLNVVVTNGKPRITWKPQPDYGLKLVLNFSIEESEVPCCEKTFDHVVRDSKGHVSFELPCEGVFNLRAHYYDHDGRHGSESDSLKFLSTPHHAPFCVAVANATTTSVYLTWKILVLESFTHYLVCVEGSSTTTPYRTNGTKQELYIEFLKPDTEYKVTVAAMNFNETRQMSDVIKIKTLFQIPALKDFNSSVDGNVALVTWLSYGKYNLMLMVNLTFLDSGEEIKPEFRTVSDSDGKLDLYLHKPGTYVITSYYFDRENNRSGMKQAVNVERPVDNVERPVDQTCSQKRTAVWVLLALVIVLFLACIAIWHRDEILRKWRMPYWPVNTGNTQPPTS